MSSSVAEHSTPLGRRQSESDGSLSWPFATTPSGLNRHSSASLEFHAASNVVADYDYMRHLRDPNSDSPTLPSSMLTDSRGDGEYLNYSSTPPPFVVGSESSDLSRILFGMDSEFDSCTPRIFSPLEIRIEKEIVRHFDEEVSSSTESPVTSTSGSIWDMRSPSGAGDVVDFDFQPSEDVAVQQQQQQNKQARLFKEYPAQAVNASYMGAFVPQKMYRPHTSADRRRYVEDIELEEPIIFWVENPLEWGILLVDALHSRHKRLVNREDTVFEKRGPSVSIRLEWPGYTSWSRQIPTKDFKCPPGPITKQKLAKNVAKNVQRFLEKASKTPMEEDADMRWRVGPSNIKFEDLVLVSLHHVSMGSWQPHLRLRTSF